MMYTYSFLKSIVKAKSVALLIFPITMTINKNSKNRTIQQRNKSVLKNSAILLNLFYLSSWIRWLYSY